MYEDEEEDVEVRGRRRGDGKMKKKT